MLKYRKLSSLYKSSRHRKSYSAEYAAWLRAKARCYDPNNPSYSRYGGRGIEMCEEWQRSFKAFYSYMGDRPSDLHSLERKDTDGNYEPGNCTWATVEEQANNRKSNIFIRVDGELLSLAQAARQWGVNYHAFWSRLKRGWSIMDSLNGKRTSNSYFRKVVYTC